MSEKTSEAGRHETIRLISSNAYQNRALYDPESLEHLLPQDDTPTITALQEVAPTKEAAMAIAALGYRALWAADHGLAFALSPHVSVDGPETITHPNRSPRKLGLQLLRTIVAGRDLILGNGHAPVFCSPSWRPVVSRDADVFSSLADANPDSIMLSLGDRNHLLEKQRERYNQLNACWGQPLLTDRTPTYSLRDGKHGWVARLGIRDPQLDGIHARAPEGMELVNTANPGPEQVGYEVETLGVASDHLALQALIRIPT